MAAKHRVPPTSAPRKPKASPKPKAAETLRANGVGITLDYGIAGDADGTCLDHALNVLAAAPPAAHVVLTVALLNEHDAPRHFLDETGKPRAFEYFDDAEGPAIAKAAAFLASLPHKLAPPEGPAPAADG